MRLKPERKRPGWLPSVALAGVLFLAGGTQAAAQESSSDWQFTFTPYFWMVGMGVETRGVGPIPSQDMNVDFSEVFENLNFAFEGNFEVRKDRFFGAFDFNYFDLSADQGLSGPAFTKAAFDLTGILSSVTLGYQVVATDAVSLDVMGGAQLFSVDASLAMRGIVSPSTSQTKTFIDPIVGLRGKIDLSDTVFVDAIGTIGGFGASSQLTYQLFGGVGWWVSEGIALRAGYRHFYIEQSGGKLLRSITLSGPILGAYFTF